MHGVRVLIAPDSFGSSLTADEAAQAMAGAWRATAPRDEVTTCPLSDGGPGFVATVHAALGGELLPVTVTSPVGAAVPAVLLLAGTTAVPRVRAGGRPAPGAGRAPRPDPDVQPRRRRAARGGDGGGRPPRRRGPGRLGDERRRRRCAGRAGAGARSRRAGRPARRRRRVAGRGRTPDDLVGLRELRDRLRGVELVVATDVDVPLLGLHGASAGFAPQKGATPEQAQDLERSLGHFAHAATAALGDALRPDLLAGTRPASATSRLTAAPGAGAAGGLGFGLALLGGRLVPGSVFVADAVGLDALIGDHDVVVTGEGRFDWQSLHGKVVSEVASRALAHAVPTVVVAGEVLVGRRELSAAGITAAYAVAETPEQVAAALADPAGSLAARSARVARTWSR